MFFPAPRGTFHAIISRQKNENYPPRLTPQLTREESIKVIEKVYGLESPAGCKPPAADNLMKVDPPSKKRKLKKVEKGKKLKGGFRRFLSNRGRTNHLVRFQKGCSGEVEEKVDFDSLTGKHLLICCFPVPLFSVSKAADQCRALIEMDDHSRPFEIVVVVKMRSDANYDQKAAFDHFLSAFSSCLAVPLSDFETRDDIYSCLCPSRERGLVNAILVDPNGVVLEADHTLEHFLYYGSEWLPPFLDSALNEIDKQDEVLRRRLDPFYANKYRDSDEMDLRYNLSLYRDILLCNPHRTLRRFESSDVGSVLELSTKYVGLYLCFDGRIIKKIKAAHDYCLANKQQLEIVLVCMSLFEEPAAYYKYLYEMLRLFNIKSWFLFDYDGKVCRRLWRVFGFKVLRPGGEKFIIVPPNCESGELLGREVITYKGVTEYPFTRSAVLKRRLEVIRSLTPIHSTLFKTGLFQDGEVYDSKQLRGKNFILYLDGFVCIPVIYFDLLMEHYPKMKGMGWEVVYVPLDGLTYKEHYVNRRKEEWDVVRHHFRADSKVEKMPWPVMSPSAAVEASVNEIMTFPPNREDGIRDSFLAAVGKNGNIVSRQVVNQLKRHGVTESLFDDVLETQLSLEMAFMPEIEDNTYVLY